MKVELYVQVVPVFGVSWKPDTVTDVRIAKTTKTRPSEPLPGARVVKVVLDVPAEQFAMQAVEVEVPDVPAMRAVS